MSRETREEIKDALTVGLYAFTSILGGASALAIVAIAFIWIGERLSGL